MIDLDIVNAMFRLESQQAVVSLQDDHPMIPTCLQIIRECRTELLAQGWWFNTTYMELYPDSSGNIPLQDNFLEVRDIIYSPGSRLVRQGDVLVDMKGNPITGVVKVRAVLNMSTTSLPHLAGVCLQANCRLVYAQDIIKDPTEADVAIQQVRRSTAALNAEHIRQVRYNPERSNRYVGELYRSYGRNRANRGRGMY